MLYKLLSFVTIQNVMLRSVLDKVTRLSLMEEATIPLWTQVWQAAGRFLLYFYVT